MTQLAIAIDTNRCVACNTCSVMCKMENNLPNNVWWTRVVVDGGANVDTPKGTFPNVKLTNYTLNCQHCGNPACTRVCPVGATFKDPDTGVVRQDVDRCIGCRMCMAACPYTGVRSFMWEEPKYYVDFPVGDADAPVHQKHTVEKCTMCWHRLAKGLQPACVEICPAMARTFGDIDDLTSEISQMIAKRQYKQLLTEKGTRPSVYYLV